MKVPEVVAWRCRGCGKTARGMIVEPPMCRPPEHAFSQPLVSRAAVVAWLRGEGEDVLRRLGVPDGLAMSRFAGRLASALDGATDGKETA